MFFDSQEKTYLSVGKRLKSIIIIKERVEWYVRLLPVKFFAGSIVELSGLI
jgi:hypothetical protein